MERLKDSKDIFLTIAELAERWQKSEWWVYTNRENLKVPGFKVGGEWRFPLDEVRAWERSKI
jgi:hypothetical protein